MIYDAEPHLANISQIAAMFKRGRSTVREIVAVSGIKPVKKIKKANYFDISEVAVLLFGKKSAMQEELPVEKMRPADRKHYYDAESKKLDLMIRAREVVPISDVRKTFKELQDSLKEKIQSYPDIVERDEGAPALEIERLEKLCDKLQEVLHEAWVE